MTELSMSSRPRPAPARRRKPAGRQQRTAESATLLIPAAVLLTVIEALQTEKERIGLGATILLVAGLLAYKAYTMDDRRRRLILLIGFLVGIVGCAVKLHESGTADAKKTDPPPQVQPHRVKPRAKPDSWTIQVPADTVAMIPTPNGTMLRSRREIWAMTGGAALIHVPGDIDDVTPCGATLSVTYGPGWGARFDIASGRMLGKPFHISDEPATSACGEGATVYTVPHGGYATHVTSHGLLPHAKISLRPGAIPAAVAITAHMTYLGDTGIGRIAVVGLDDDTVRPTTITMPEPDLLAPLRGWLLVGEQLRGCLRIIDTDDDKLRARSLALEGPLRSLTVAANSTLVLADHGHEIDWVDVPSLHLHARLRLRTRALDAAPRPNGDGWLVLTAGGTVHVLTSHRLARQDARRDLVAGQCT